MRKLELGHRKCMTGMMFVMENIEMFHQCWCQLMSTPAPAPRDYYSNGLGSTCFVSFGQTVLSDPFPMGALAHERVWPSQAKWRLFLIRVRERRSVAVFQVERFSTLASKSNERNLSITSLVVFEITRIQDLESRLGFHCAGLMVSKAIKDTHLRCNSGLDESKRS